MLLGILGGVETWGLLGLFLGPAIMAALILLWREWTAGGNKGMAGERVAGTLVGGAPRPPLPRPLPQAGG